MDWVQGVLARDRRAVARLISWAENGHPQAAGLLAALYAHTGRAHIVGVTGVPGAGKSTLVNAITQVYRRQNTPVGILAIDPSSPFSGGALLGDRIRMQALSGDEGVFIRSMAGRGAVGGLCAAAWDAVQILDAAGYETIFIETVGVGQDEVDIARLAHTVVVVDAPGLGDEVQTLKAGLAEIADLFVVNKADRPGAEQAARALEWMLSMSDTAHPAWQPPVRLATAVDGRGIEQVVADLQAHRRYLQSSDGWRAREQARADWRLSASVQRMLWERFRSGLTAGQWQAWVSDLAARQRSLDDILKYLKEQDDERAF